LIASTLDIPERDSVLSFTCFPPLAPARERLQGPLRPKPAWIRLTRP